MTASPVLTIHRVPLSSRRSAAAAAPGGTGGTDARRAVHRATDGQSRLCDPPREAGVEAARNARRDRRRTRLAAAAQVRQDGEHAPVLGGRLPEAELVEDACDV